jgi:hypothetical protein
MKQLINRNVIYTFLLQTGVWTASVAKWSEFLTTDPEIRVRFPSYQIF